jgi:thiazolinyl imide reductase
MFNVLVCGTNYGRTYLDAIELGGADYRLVGILANGSVRSQEVARANGVPLYRCVESLAPGIDLACAAMGASASDVVLDLLKQGIHVLCEHPQKPSQLESALGTAASRGLCLHVNGHFADLEAAVAFISYCRRVSSSAPPSFFHVTITDRSLYAALDILRRVLPSFAPFQFHVTSRLPPFTVVQGLLSGIPVTLHLQHNAHGRLLPDGSAAYLVDHRIVAGFPTGILTLLSINGPVIWNANPHCVPPRGRPLFTVAHEDRALTAERLCRQRVAANFAAISAVAKNIRERDLPPQQAPHYLLDVSRAWEAIGTLL